MVVPVWCNSYTGKVALFLHGSYKPVNKLYKSSHVEVWLEYIAHRDNFTSGESVSSY